MVSLPAVGTVQPINTRIAHVRPLARGRIIDVFVRVGDRVRAAQPLATFDNIEAGELLAQLEGARTELLRLKLQQTAAEKIADRNKRLSVIGAVLQKQAELAEVEAQSAADNVRVQVDSARPIAPA